jgi:hypothetical protein
MEEDDTLDLLSIFLREMLSERKSEDEVEVERNDNAQWVDGSYFNTRLLAVSP